MLELWQVVAPDTTLVWLGEPDAEIRWKGGGGCRPRVQDGLIVAQRIRLLTTTKPLVSTTN